MLDEAYDSKSDCEYIFSVFNMRRIQHDYGESDID